MPEHSDFSPIMQPLVLATDNDCKRPLQTTLFHTM